GEDLGFGQVPDSNSYLLAGLVTRFGGEVVLRRAVGDDQAEFRAALDEALAADVVVTTGGVSVGAFEVVRQVTEGDEISFERVNMQPGKPQASGLLRAPDGRGVAFLGFPGNPVSAWVSAWLFLRPLLLAFTVPERVASEERGRRPVEGRLHPDTFVLPVRETWRKTTERRQYIPVKVVDGGVAPSHALGSGSHLIGSLHLADGIAIVPADADGPGDTVEVLLTR
ncbi:MAG TPA: molybdopterin molybdenumtransferase MoeA, partial [Propionibacterium sp.]|nr:molybdopterin molybdenumtransferase MoeA [Propionibacterium sp.]